LNNKEEIAWGGGKNTTSKTCGTRSSVVVQWLRVCLPMQGTWVRTLVRELGSHCCGAAEPPATTEPTSPGAYVPQLERSLCTTTNDPATKTRSNGKKKKAPVGPPKKVYVLTSLKSLKKTEGMALKVLEKK